MLFFGPKSVVGDFSLSLLPVHLGFLCSVHARMSTRSVDYSPGGSLGATLGPNCLTEACVWTSASILFYFYFHLFGKYCIWRLLTPGTPSSFKLFSHFRVEPLHALIQTPLGDKFNVVHWFYIWAE